MASRLAKDSWVFTAPVAHRGLHNEKIGENTMEAFKNAIAHGLPIEMDVQLSKDGVMVCYHDDGLKRITGADGYINDLTFEELQQLDVLGLGQKIPTFEAFLKEVNGQVPLMIEIKQQRSKEYDIAKLVCDALKDYKGEFVVQSFDPFIMNKVKKYAPHILRGQLGGVYSPKDTTPIKRFVVKNMCFNFLTKPDYVNYILRDLPIKCKIPTICWTVRTEEDLKRARELKVNFVFENVEP